MTALDRVTDALDSLGLQWKASAGNLAAQCPSHEDRTASLSITGKPDKVLIRCHAGCAQEDVVLALRLKMADLYDEPIQPRERSTIVTVYPYTDEQGVLLFEVCRMVPKTFRQRRPDGTWGLGDTRRVLYRLPEVVAGVAAGKAIWITEGEKDADRLASLGAVATCNPMGAGKWRHEYADSLVGAARVIIVADADTPGRDHAREVARSISPKVGGAYTIVEPAEGKDLSDHLDAHRGLDELVDLRDDEPEDAVDSEAPTGPFADLPPGLAAELLDDKLAAEVEKLQRNRRARQITDEIESLRNPVPPPDAAMLAEILTRDVSTAWRVDDLWPAGGRLLLTAQRKAGKTTMTGNLAYSLLTGSPFLGRFATKPIDGRVIAMNYEVTAEQYARWMGDMGVPADRVFTINLRGRHNLLGDELGRAALTKMIQEQSGEVLIVDPFGRAYTGKSQNDTSEVTPWLVQLDAVAEEAGIREVVLVAHAGWNGERTRGASGLEDWADSILTLVRDENSGDRFLRAIGRDVEMEEDKLDYDENTRRLTLAGAGSRRQVAQLDRMNALAVAVRDAVIEQPEINVTGLEDALKAKGVGFQKGDVSQAALLAEHRGWITRRKVGRSMCHFPTDAAKHPDDAGQRPPTNPEGFWGASDASRTQDDAGQRPPTNPDEPPGSFGRTPTPPYMGGVRSGGVEEDQPQDPDWLNDTTDGLAG